MSTEILQVFGNGSEICLSTESDELQPVTITNTGKTILTNIEVEVTIPTGLEYLSDNPSVGTFDDGTGIWTIASLGVGNSATLDLCFTVTDDTEVPFKVLYTATHDDSQDAVEDDDSERNLFGLTCSKFTKCLDIYFTELEEFDTMEDAISELGSGKPFLYSQDNLDGATYRGLHVTPF